MPSHAVCRREVTALHAFFVDWYTGQTARDSYNRVTDALSSEFEMVTPDGTRREYAAIVDEVRERYNGRKKSTFDIDIRNVETRCAVNDHRLVRYEEWQETPDRTTGRLSTVFFEGNPDAPGDVVWLDVHSTWLDGPGPNQE